MFEYLIISQQMPAQPQAPQQQYPQQPQQVPQQYPQQPAPAAAQPAPAQPAAAQPVPGAAPAAQPAPTAVVSMGKMLQWSALGGAASGAIQAALNLASGFDVVNFLMTVGIAVVLGILIAIILGQFGSKIPLKATLMVKAAAFMFVLNLIAGFIFGMGAGALGMILGIVGIGAGAFVYGWLLQKKVPGLV